MKTKTSETRLVYRVVESAGADGVPKLVSAEVVVTETQVRFSTRAAISGYDKVWKSRDLDRLSETELEAWMKYAAAKKESIARLASMLADAEDKLTIAESTVETLAPSSCLECGQNGSINDGVCGVCGTRR